MAVVPYILAYLAIAVFLVAVIMRVVYWSKMPMHVRWELYPVAHEAKKAHYGGSYLEESEWWTKPREKSLLAELKVMLPEIFFLVALRENNKKLWYRSFPFHFGLYLVIAATFAMGFFALLLVISPAAAMGGFGSFVLLMVKILGLGGLGLGLFGAAGLLERRLSDPDLKDFTAPADIFNLVFFLVAFGVTFVSFFLVEGFFEVSAMFMYNLITFNLAALPLEGLSAILPMVSVVLLSALVAYIPMTHMSHFIGKYFAYHAIRWNDEPNLRGGPQEKEIGKNLARPVSWSAPHIKGDGKKSWAEVATEEHSK